MLFALAYTPDKAPIDQIAAGLGPNGLPYSLPIHPNLVHLTIGLFVIAIAFDVVGALYPLEKRVFRFLALPITRGGFHDVGWYNLLACCLVSFFTVAAGFYEMLTAVPLPGEEHVWSRWHDHHALARRWRRVGAGGDCRHDGLAWLPALLLEA